VTVRAATPADAAAIAEVHIASWRSSYRGVIDEAYLASLDVAARTAAWDKRLANAEILTLVSEDRGRVVGFCCAGANRGADPTFRGEVYAIYLLDDAKGQGNGSALWRPTLAWLAERGLVPVRVEVLADNPVARGFYERMGGVLTGEPGSVTLAGKTYAEVAYLFPIAVR
jgi:ribosomal protein S18 acetylase RimI-like enzyme